MLIAKDATKQMRDLLQNNAKPKTEESFVVLADNDAECENTGLSGAPDWSHDFDSELWSDFVGDNHRKLSRRKQVVPLKAEVASIVPDTHAMASPIDGATGSVSEARRPSGVDRESTAVELSCDDSSKLVDKQDSPFSSKSSEETQTTGNDDAGDFISLEPDLVESADQADQNLVFPELLCDVPMRDPSGANVPRIKADGAKRKQARPERFAPPSVLHKSGTTSQGDLCSVSPSQGSSEQPSVLARVGQTSFPILRQVLRQSEKLHSNCSRSTDVASTSSEPQPATTSLTYSPGTSVQYPVNPATAINHPAEPLDVRTNKPAKIKVVIVRASSATATRQPQTQSHSPGCPQTTSNPHPHKGPLNIRPNKPVKIVRRSILKIVQNGQVQFFPVDIVQTPGGPTMLQVVRGDEADREDQVLTPIPALEKYKGLPKFGPSVTELTTPDSENLRDTLIETKWGEDDVKDFEKWFELSPKEVCPKETLLCLEQKRSIFQTPHNSMFDYRPWSSTEEKIASKCYGCKECKVVVDKLTFRGKSVNLRKVLQAQLYCGNEYLSDETGSENESDSESSETSSETGSESEPTDETNTKMNKARNGNRSSNKKTKQSDWIRGERTLLPSPGPRSVEPIVIVPISDDGPDTESPVAPSLIGTVGQESFVDRAESAHITSENVVGEVDVITQDEGATSESMDCAEQRVHPVAVDPQLSTDNKQEPDWVEEARRPELDDVEPDTGTVDSQTGEHCGTRSLRFPPEHDYCRTNEHVGEAQHGQKEPTARAKQQTGFTARNDTLRKIPTTVMKRPLAARAQNDFGKTTHDHTTPAKLRRTTSSSFARNSSAPHSASAAPPASSPTASSTVARRGGRVSGSVQRTVSVKNLAVSILSEVATEPLNCATSKARDTNSRLVHPQSEGLPTISTFKEGSTIKMRDVKLFEGGSEMVGCGKTNRKAPSTAVNLKSFLSLEDTIGDMSTCQC